MSINYQTLATELNTDPKAMGYVTLLGGDQQIADALNAVTGPGAQSIFRSDVMVQQILLALTSLADWDLIAATGALNNSIQLLAMIEPIDCSKSNMQSLLTHIFVGLTAGSKAAITAAIQRTGSRAEVLFGTGTVVSASDVAKAEGRPG